MEEDQVVRDRMVEEEEELDYHMIDELQQHNINASDLNKLKEAGLCTITAVHQITKRKLGAIKGITEAKIDKIKEAAQKILPQQFVTANAFLEKRKFIFRVSTGSKELDKILLGGIESMSITEAHGEWRTGKTQLAHTLCITAQIPSEENRYSGGKVIFIDTESTFRPERLRPICERFNLDYNAALDNIYYFRAHTSEMQMDALCYATALLSQEPSVVKLLIIDSVMALLRVDYCGRGELADRQQALNQMLSRLQKISEEWNISIYMTNQMTADPGAGMSFVPDPKKPIGGHVLAHAVHTRLSMRKGRGEERICKVGVTAESLPNFRKVVDSPMLAEAEATFLISNGGIADTA